MDADEIRVKVIRRAGRKHLVYRYTAPWLDGWKERTAGTHVRSKADRGVPAFIEWVKSQRPTNDTTWQTACRRYEREHLRTLRPKTAKSWASARRK